MHTTASDGALSPEDMMLAIDGLNIRYKEHIGHNYLDVVGVSDHNTVEGGYRAKNFALKENFGFEVVVCEEITSLDGHILAVDIKSNIPKLMSSKDTIEHIHSQGGLAIAAHPYTIANIAGKTGFKGVKGLIKTQNFDAVETINSNPTEFFNNIYAHIVNSGGFKDYFNNAIDHIIGGRTSGSFHNYWPHLANHGRLAEVGNSDSHFPGSLEKVWTEFPGITFQEYKAALLAKKTIPKGHIWGIFQLGHYLKDRKIMKEYYSREPKYEARISVRA